jgi:hypothetical protein
MLTTPTEQAGDKTCAAFRVLEAAARATRAGTMPDRSGGRDGNFISLSAHSARFDLLRLF